MDNTCFQNTSLWYSVSELLDLWLKFPISCLTAFQMNNTKMLTWSYMTIPWILLQTGTWSVWLLMGVGTFKCLKTIPFVFPHVKPLSPNNNYCMMDRPLLNSVSIVDGYPRFHWLSKSFILFVSLRTAGWIHDFPFLFDLLPSGGFMPTKHLEELNAKEMLQLF